MHFFSPIRVAGLAAALAFAGPASALPVLQIDLLFDANRDGALEPPFVGLGQLSLDADPGDGEHLLDTLSGLSLAVTFPDAGYLFPLSGLVDGQDEVFLKLDTLPGGRAHGALRNGGVRRLRRRGGDRGRREPLAAVRA